MFLHLCVILFRGGCAVRETPLNKDPPPTVKSERYASYWNALLLKMCWRLHDLIPRVANEDKKNKIRSRNAFLLLHINKHVMIVLVELK